MIDREKKIFVAGHQGMLGRALISELKGQGCEKVITAPRSELDLCDRAAVVEFFKRVQPEIVIIAAGRTGGIIANKTKPATFLYDNLSIQVNLFEEAHLSGVEKVVFYASSCVYPRLCEQPMKEEYLLGGHIEETSDGYAAAKIAGLLGCKSYNTQYNATRFLALLPNSMYGPGDNFDPESSHVLSALIRKFHIAKVEKQSSVELWGSGSPRREFVASRDVARATLFALDNSSKMENFHYNIGSGSDYSIKELAEIIAGVVGFDGEISWDSSKPDGTPRKLLDSSRFRALGWEPEVDFSAGIESTYRWFLENLETTVK